MSTTPQLLSLRLRQQSHVLELAFEDGLNATLSEEFLRVHSPSAEVRGHGQGQAVLQTGKRQVTISKIEPVGHYAVKLHFSDGHNSGLYTWDWLYHLAKHHTTLWAEYLAELERAHASRDSA